MSSSGDGCDAVTTADEESFSAWLAEHGALYPKIEWPTRQTVGGVRGTTARADIASGEREMLQIPLKLMMAPPTTEKSEAFGELMRAYDIVPRGSMLSLTVFLLLEKILKGEASFWHPYIRMLPHPGTTLDWSAAELVELQDETVHSESQRLRAQHAVKFHACFERLRERFPAIVGATKSESAALGFTAPAWEWCAMNVQARCFGRRLPWLALVPFADSLNHANVATKYDFDVEDNGCFRLFPVGSNSYAQGAEVFNSYVAFPPLLPLCALSLSLSLSLSLTFFLSFSYRPRTHPLLSPPLPSPSSLSTATAAATTATSLFTTALRWRATSMTR